MEGGAPVDSAPVPVPEAAPAPSGDSPSPIQGVIQAHSDFLAWLYQPHGALFDKAMGHLDASGVRREHAFYGLFALLTLCLCVCSSAPLLSALITVLYPAFSSASAIKDVSQSPRWMVYWTIFGLLAVLDFFLAEVPLYFLLKTLGLVFLYLPQTQGAVFVHSKIIDPVYNVVDGYVLKKIQ